MKKENNNLFDNYIKERTNLFIDKCFEHYQSHSFALNKSKKTLLLSNIFGVFFFIMLNIMSSEGKIGGVLITSFALMLAAIYSVVSINVIREINRRLKKSN